MKNWEQEARQLSDRNCEQRHRIEELEAGEAHLTAEVERLTQENEQLRAAAPARSADLIAADLTIERLRATLEFYSRPTLYEVNGAAMDPGPGERGDPLLQRWDLIDDGGERARVALTGKR